MHESIGAEDDAGKSPGHRAQAIAFWTGLLGKLAKAMDGQSLKPSVAFGLLDEKTHRKAKAWSKDKERSPAVLGSKLKVRAENGKLFVALGNDLYRALGAGQAEPSEADAAMMPSPMIVEAPPEQALSAAPSAIEEIADLERALMPRPISDREGSVETRETQPVSEPERTPPPRGTIRHGLSVLRGKPDDDADGEWHAGMEVARFDLQGKPILPGGAKLKKGRFHPRNWAKVR